MTVDVNGNHYAWNSRNQLTGITGANSATFSYDGLGRRATKQIGSVATTFQYDGWNRIAETSAGATATQLPGALDEYFLRTDSNGAMVPITDALGSTRGLVNSSGQIATSDWYDPYGNMTTTGAATANSTTYTGRESDGDGLLFYRARYYNPSTGRFIGEDPSGFAGGDLDLYRYVGDDPISFVDPFGLDKGHPHWWPLSQPLLPTNNPAQPCNPAISHCGHPRPANCNSVACHPEPFTPAPFPPPPTCQQWGDIGGELGILGGPWFTGPAAWTVYLGTGGIYLGTRIFC